MEYNSSNFSIDYIHTTVFTELQRGTPEYKDTYRQKLLMQVTPVQIDLICV